LGDCTVYLLYRVVFGREVAAYFKKEGVGMRSNALECGIADESAIPLNLLRCATGG